MADPKKEAEPAAAAAAAAAPGGANAAAADAKAAAAAAVPGGAGAGAAAAKPADAPAAGAKKDWSCAVCTLVNHDVYATKCSACGSVNPNPQKRPQPAARPGAGGGGVGGGGGGEKWSCSTCTYLNGAAAGVCWSCQTPRYPKPKPAAAKPPAPIRKESDGDDIDPALAAAMAGLAGVDGGGAVGADVGGHGGALPIAAAGGGMGLGGAAGLGNMAAAAAMLGAMNGGGGGGFGGARVDVGPNNAAADMITQIAKQFGRLPVYILKGEKLIEEFRGMVYWLSIVELFLFLLGVACFCSFLDSKLMVWVWLYSGHIVRPIIGFLLVSKIPHVAQVVEIVLSADRLEEGLALVPQQMQPLLLPIAARLLFWLLFGFLSFFPDMVGLIFRLIDFQLSSADVANGEQLPWIVLFGLAIIFVLCDIYVFAWLGLVWNSVPPYLQLQARNMLRQALGRPPLPDQPLLPANAAANANGGGAAPNAAQRA